MPTTRVAGPETGESTWVDLSPLKATLPVASTTGRKLVGCTVTRCNRWRCSGVTVKAPGFVPTESAAFAVSELEHAEAASTTVRPARGRRNRRLIGLLQSWRCPAHDRDRPGRYWRRRARRRAGFVPAAVPDAQ